KRSEGPVRLVYDRREGGLLGSVALVTASIPIPAGRPGRHMRHVPRPCNPVFTYRLSLSGKFFYPQPKCLPLLDIASQCPSLPLDRCRWFSADVIDNTRNPFQLIDNPIGNPSEEVVGQMRPMRRHEVDRLDGAQRDDPLVGTRIADHADGFDRQEDGEGL